MNKSITWRRARAKAKVKENDEKAEIPGTEAAKATQMEREEKETARTEKAAKEKKRDFVSGARNRGISKRCADHSLQASQRQSPASQRAGKKSAARAATSTH